VDLMGDGPWLARRAARTPDREALRFAGRSFSYAELAREARRVAAALRRAGVSDSDVVAVAVAPEPAALALLHAVAACRALLLPLNLRLTPSELAFQLRDSGARWLVVAGGSAAEATARAALRDAPGAAVLDLRELTRSEPVSDAIDGGEKFDPERPFALLYTSGTSGRPKGAVLSYASFAASALGSAALVGVRPRDLWLACLPIFHVGGLSIATRSVLAGTSVLLHTRFDPEALSRDLDTQPVTLVSLVPTMLARLLEVRGHRPAPPGLRAVLLGGGPAAPELLARARRAGWPVAPTYGLTEAASQVATRPPGDDAPPLAGRLRPLEGTRVRVVDDGGRPVPTGEVGEILVSGPTVMLGYWKRPAETAATLRGGWLHTGDLGRLDAEGLLEVVDRRADLIVSGGENVYPAEVEAVLAGHADVADVAVVGVPDADYGARPVASWVARPDGPLARLSEAEAEAALRAFCRERLAGYKVPVRFQRVDVLPRNATGKLLRRALRP